MRLALVVIGCAALAAGCAARKVGPEGPAPASTVHVGDCADPDRDGVLSTGPALDRADRDLNGDRQPEAVVVDRNLCSGRGNCHWNIFSREAANACFRYVGTVSAATIEELEDRGERGFSDLRAWWNLTGGGRLLMQQYRFRRGGYHIIEALVCRTIDDRLLCAEEDEPEER